MIDKIKPTCDRKTRAYKNESNTFGLLPGPRGSCPHATTGVGGCWNKPVGHRLHTCYVDNIMRVYHNVKGALRYNTKLLMKLTRRGMTEQLAIEFHRFLTANDRYNTNNEGKAYPAYRIHWSGDIFNLDYANALASAMTMFPRIRFWCYTRSLFAVPVLCDVPNLSLYMSADECNICDVIDCYRKYGDKSNRLNIAYMSKENDLINYTALRRIKVAPCPADAGSMAVDGACNKCRMCIDGKKSVWFAT